MLGERIPVINKRFFHPRRGNAMYVHEDCTIRGNPLTGETKTVSATSWVVAVDLSTGGCWRSPLLSVFGSIKEMTEYGWVAEPFNPPKE